MVASHSSGTAGDPQAAVSKRQNSSIAGTAAAMRFPSSPRPPLTTPLPSAVLDGQENAGTQPQPPVTSWKFNGGRVATLLSAGTASTDAAGLPQVHRFPAGDVVLRDGWGGSAHVLGTDLTWAVVAPTGQHAREPFRMSVIHEGTFEHCVERHADDLHAPQVPA